MPAAPSEAWPAGPRGPATDGQIAEWPPLVIRRVGPDWPGTMGYWSGLSSAAPRVGGETAERVVRRGGAAMRGAGAGRGEGGGVGGEAVLDSRRYT